MTAHLRAPGWYRAGAYLLQIWAQTIVHYAIAFHRHALARDQMVKSLTPLYLGRTATFIRRNADRCDDEAEADVQALARVFADAVRELHRLWKEGP